MCGVSGKWDEPFCVSQARIAKSDSIQFLEGNKPMLTADRGGTGKQRQTADRKGGATGEQVKEDGSGPQKITADTDDAVCVDARVLSHLHTNGLVFRTNRRARLLCDSAGSCATAGHIMVFRGSGECMQNRLLKG